MKLKQFHINQTILTESFLDFQIRDILKNYKKSEGLFLF